MASSHIPIGFKNTTAETIPPYAVMQLESDCVHNSATGVISVSVAKPTGDTGEYAINEDTERGPGDFGSCYRPVTGLAWARYTKPTPPGAAWSATVGPVAGQWEMDTTGDGFLYVGRHEPENSRILVLQMTGGGAVKITWGVILEQCSGPCSLYRVQRVHRHVKTLCDGSGSGSGSGA